jgi:hypothetical protein
MYGVRILEQLLLGKPKALEQSGAGRVTNCRTGDHPISIQHFEGIGDQATTADSRDPLALIRGTHPAFEFDGVRLLRDAEEGNPPSDLPFRNSSLSHTVDHE